MDFYTITFILATFWVGPFWFAMLLSPEKDKTKKKKYRCTAIKSDGKRCKNQVDKKVLRCYAHR